MKVCIFYGWTEGRWHAQRLQLYLQEAGYQITTKVDEADIIIGHSGGCYMLPDEIQARLILLIGLPYWSGKHPTQGIVQKVSQEQKNLWWYKKTCFSVYYLLTQPRHWARMKKALGLQTLPTGNSAQVILIRNKLDPFMHQDESRQLATEKSWTFKEFEGDHDDLWMFPEKYVDLINQRIR